MVDTLKTILTKDNTLGLKKKKRERSMGLDTILQTSSHPSLIEPVVTSWDTGFYNDLQRSCFCIAQAPVGSYWKPTQAPSGRLTVKVDIQHFYPTLTDALFLVNRLVLWSRACTALLRQPVEFCLFLISTTDAGKFSIYIFLFAFRSCLWRFLLCSF